MPDYKQMYEELVSEINRWWQYSVLIDPDIEELLEQFPETMSVAISHDPQFGHMYTAEYHSMVLHRVIVALEYDRGSRDMHLLVKHKNTRLGYYLTEDAIENFRGAPYQLMRYLTSETLSLFEKERNKK